MPGSGRNSRVAAPAPAAEVANGLAAAALGASSRRTNRARSSSLTTSVNLMSLRCTNIIMLGVMLTNFMLRQRSGAVLIGRSDIMSVWM